MFVLETRKDTLLKPLQAAVGVVERKHTLPILANILIEAVDDRTALVATDLELQITTWMAVECAAGTALTVSARKLLDICRALPEGESIKLGLEGEQLKITSGKSRFSLQTLPARDFAAGLGESVKHAVISGEEFLAWHERHAAEILARDADVLSELIARNCAVKADIVSRDEREAGLRAVLNYGHTVGHALEHFLDYELRHGECVGLGMIAANELSCRRGLLAVPVAERIRELLSCLGLPGHVPRRLDPKQVVAVCRMDKKARCGAVNFMLARGPGQIERVSDVADAEIVAALAAIES